MLLSACIIMIEAIYSIPLLIMTYVNGDAMLAKDLENPTFTNASIIVVVVSINDITSIHYVHNLHRTRDILLPMYTFPAVCHQSSLPTYHWY